MDAKTRNERTGRPSDVPELAHLPHFLSIEQAAAVLEISRTATYQLANDWLRTSGADGLPVIRLGRTLRVPRAALERLQSIDVAADR